MNDDTTISPLHQPGSILDPLTEIAREGARQMLAAALKAEVANFVARFADERLSDGRQRVVHHGTGPERTIQTGIGPLAVKRHKVRDRAAVGAEKRIRFTSNILPRWARRSRSLDALLPVLYLRGVSMGDFQEALTALLGPDAPNLSPGVTMTYDNDIGPVGKTSVSALFDSQADAQRAVDRLVAAGIPESHIRQVTGGSGTTAPQSWDEDRKGFWDSLSDFFFPDEDRYTYAEGLSRGGYLVTVSGISGSEYETALDILDEEGSVNLDERAESWRSEGWGGYEASSYASGSTASAYGARAGMTGDLDSPYIDEGSLRADASFPSDRDLRDDETIPVVEERIRIGKRETAHGRVRVRAYTVEEPVNESVDLREERVEIERRPVDREITSADAAFQDRTIEAEEYREEAVVEKEARVVEEIGLRKTSETRREDISDTVRRTEVEIEKDDAIGDRDTLTGGLRRDDIDRTKI